MPGRASLARSPAKWCCVPLRISACLVRASVRDWRLHCHKHGRSIITIVRLPVIHSAWPGSFTSSYTFCCHGVDFAIAASGNEDYLQNASCDERCHAVVYIPGDKHAQRPLFGVRAASCYRAAWSRVAPAMRACVRACLPELYKTLFNVNPHFAPSTHDVMLPVSEVSVQTVPALDVHVAVDRSILGALRGPWHCHAAVQSWFSLLPHLVHLSSQIFSVCLVNAYSPLWHLRGSNTLNSSRLLAR